MKLLIKQRVFSWTDTYDVYDEYDEPKYFVKAEMFRLTHQIHIYDRDRNEIGMIKQRFFTLMPTFDIEINGHPFGSIEKKFTFFKPKYNLDYNGWRCEGDFMSWNYSVYEACSMVRRFQKSCSVGEILMLSTMQTRETKFGAYARNCNRRRKLYAE